MEPDEEVIKTQIKVFKVSVGECLKANKGVKKIDKKETVEEGAVAKVLEEMKLMVRELPLRLEQRMIEGPERSRPRKYRRLHPMMIDEMVHMISRGPGDPISILFIASFVREDFPWLYEIGVEAYRTVKSGSIQEAHDALRYFRDSAEATIRGPLMEEMGISKEAYVMLRELPMIIEHSMHRILSGNRAHRQSKTKDDK